MEAIVLRESMASAGMLNTILDAGARRQPDDPYKHHSAPSVLWQLQAQSLFKQSAKGREMLQPQRHGILCK